MKRNLFLSVLPLLLFAEAACGIEIKLPENARPYDRNAAALLKKYAQQIDKNSKTNFVFKTDFKMPEEAWHIAGDGKTVTFTSGKKGAFIAVAHYLQDVCQVMFYSPFERDFLKRELPAKFAPLSGKPAFPIREIFSTYGNDGGEFAVLRGLNSDNCRGISAKFGGRRLYGPPYFVHTLGMYFPVDKYFKQHPEWYSQINGKRLKIRGAGGNGSQLCLSNKELRKATLQKLRAYIAQGDAAAKKSGMEPPWIYTLSQSDNQRYCQCKECNALAQKYGNAQSGVSLDFINELAREIRKERPEIHLLTGAYQYTEKLPQGIKPESNVMISVTDTASNVLVPLTSPQNKYFYKLLSDWSSITQKPAIWDYNITYQEPREMPYNSEWTYQPDLKVFREKGVSYVFFELEEPVRGDARDYKMYLKTALMENPDLDVKQLSEKFCRNYYGKAAGLFLEYREILKKSQLKKGTFLGMYPTMNAFTHLDYATVSAAQKLFDEGEKILKNDPVRLRRWNHTRMSLDRATLIMTKNHMQECLKKDGHLKGYHFDRKKIAQRINETVKTQVKLRQTAKDAAKTLKAQLAETAHYGAPINPRSLKTPEQFKNIPADKLFDFSMESSSRWYNYVKLVDDPESDTGKAACISFPHENKKIKLEDYKLPITIGIHSPMLKTLWWSNLNRSRVKKPGYNWYKMGESVLSSDCLLYIFKSWYIKQGVAGAFDMNKPDQKFEVWVKIKFTGPAYPCGKKEDKNAIWIERVTLVKK